MDLKKKIKIWLVLLLAFVLCGCVQEEKTDKVKDLEYTIVEKEDIPEELSATIEEKKTAEFKVTYETEDALYVARGYGEQETGGYSIAVKDFYLTKNAVCCYTELIGPSKTENKSKSPSFPYIVLRTAKQNKNVIFQ